MTKALRFALFTALASILLVGGISAQKIAHQAISPFLKGKTSFLNKADSSRNFVSTGLSVVAKNMMVYFIVDTIGAGPASTSFAWTLAAKPAGSAAVMYGATNQISAKFIPDAVGQYIVNAAVAGKTLADTIFVSTYKGTAIDATCEFCHSRPEVKKFDKWKLTKHANIFKEGITGLLEVDAITNKGAYAQTCIKCHTTGWENKADNGNFGYLANKTNFTNGGVTATWDSTWWRGLTIASGDYWIPKNDQTLWTNLPSVMKPTATVGCEVCHGPAMDHASTADVKKTAKTLQSGVCNQCHAASLSKHRIGIDWAVSGHGKLLYGGETSRSGCFPCHSGGAFYKFANGIKYDTTGDASQKNVDGNIPIGCPVCHDPHGNSNTADLRKVTVDTLQTGYKITGGGVGQLCMNCHRGRSNVNTKVTNTAPSYGFSTRFYNHYSPQADMLWGQNGFEFAQTITKQHAHQAVPNSCVGCHMPPTTTNTMISNHTMSMDTAKVAGCKMCHPTMTTFNDKAKADYDGNGTISGYHDEINGLMTKLKALLPKDPATGDVIQGPLRTAADSALWKGKKNVVASVWNYWFVKNDFSGGIHNPSYTIGLLQASIAKVTGVSRENSDVTPSTFELSQNYPNPFNPSTMISFALPKEANVQVNVYDLTGKLVRSLVNEQMTAGKYNVTWDGMNRAGEQVTSGVYIYRIEAGSFTAAKKMLLVK